MLAALRMPEPITPIGRFVDRIPRLAQSLHDRLTQRLIVFHNQNAHDRIVPSNPTNQSFFSPLSLSSSSSLSTFLLISVPSSATLISYGVSPILASAS